MSYDTFKKKVKKMDFFLLNNKEFEYLGIISLSTEKRLMSSKLGDKIGALALTQGTTIHYTYSENITAPDIGFLTLHELFHIMCGHVYRKDFRDSVIFNMAADHVVNSLILDIIKETKTDIVNMLPNAYINYDLYKNKKNISFEEVYDILERNIKKDYSSGIPNMKVISYGYKINSDNGTMVIDESDVEEEIYDPNDNNTHRKFKKNRIYYVYFKDSSGNEFYIPLDTNFVAEDTPESECIDKLVDDARLRYVMDKSASFSLGRGNMPGCLKFFLTDLFKIEIPWQEILKDAIQYPIAVQDERSWCWPEECYLPLGYYLPGKTKSSGQDYLVVCIDTSGSIMTDVDNLKEFISVVCDSANYYDRLIVLVHDVDIQNEFIIEENTSPDVVFNKIKNLGGGGGTSHLPVFNRIEQLMEGEENINISSVIFLTDFISDVQFHYEKFKFLKDITSTWVLNTPYMIDLKGINTTTIHINSEKKTRKKIQYAC